MSLLKQYLLRLNDPLMAEDLLRANADDRLLAVIRRYHEQTPIRGLIIDDSLHLAVPQHPSDVVHISLGYKSVAEVVRHFQARALLVTNRAALDDLLMALDFPTRYDLAILLTRGNVRRAALELVKTIVRDTPQSAYRDPQRLVPIWVVHDASAEGAQLPYEICNALRQNGLSEDCLIDIGLKVSDSAIDDLWVTQQSAGPTLSGPVIEAWMQDLSEGERRVLVQEGKSVFLDAMAPDQLSAWFERRLDELDLPRKAVPDALMLATLAGEQIRKQLQQVLERVAFDSLGLDDAFGWFVAEFNESIPNLRHTLLRRIEEMLRDEPSISWRMALERAQTELMKDYLTEQRLERLRQELQEGS